jgi:hypothetical protein
MRDRDSLIDAALWAVIAMSSLITLLFSFGVTAPGADRYSIADEIGHATIQFVTTFCLLLTLVWRPGRGDGVLVSLGALPIAGGIVGIGIVIEVMQEVGTTTRHAELGDVVAQAVGAFAAVGLHDLIRRRSI